MIIFGAVVDLTAMFILWPYFGESWPTAGQAFILVGFGMFVGLVGLLVAKVRRKK